MTICKRCKKIYKPDFINTCGCNNTTNTCYSCLEKDFYGSTHYLKCNICGQKYSNIDFVTQFIKFNKPPMLNALLIYILLFITSISVISYFIASYKINSNILSNLKDDTCKILNITSVNKNNNIIDTINISNTNNTIYLKINIDNNNKLEYEEIFHYILINSTFSCYIYNNKEIIMNKKYNILKSSMKESSYTLFVMFIMYIIFSLVYFIYFINKLYFYKKTANAIDILYNINSLDNEESTFSINA